MLLRKNIFTKFNKQLKLFTIKKRNLPKFKKIQKKTNLSSKYLSIISKKISKNKNKINHKILISNESQNDNKICINLCNNKVTISKNKTLPFNSHYFIVQDNEFNQWVKNKITFEEVLGTRRFRYERYPNKYDVKVKHLYKFFIIK